MITLATCCNARFFGACLTLIESAHRFSSQNIKEILVYDLGLKPWQRLVLGSLKSTKIINFSHDLVQDFPDFFHAKQFAWKQYVWRDLHQRCLLALYIDAGIEILSSLSNTEKIIQDDGILLVESDNWKTHEFTHLSCAKAMNATDEEMNSKMLCSGIVGINSEGPYSQMFKDAYEFAKIEECIRGSDSENPKKHRQDQSILSILSARYNCPRQSAKIYAEWRWQIVKSNPDSVLHVHRSHRGIRMPTPQLEENISWHTKILCNLLIRSFNLTRKSKYKNNYS